MSLRGFLEESWLAAVCTMNGALLYCFRADFSCSRCWLCCKAGASAQFEFLLQLVLCSIGEQFGPCQEDSKDHST